MAGLAALLLLLAAGGLEGVSAWVAMVYSIHRHGARNALPKSLTLKESDAIGGVTLLPEGERLCFNAGAQFRSRYLGENCTASSTCISASDGDYGVYNLGNG